MYQNKVLKLTTIFTQSWQTPSLWVLLLSTLLWGCDDPQQIGTEVFGEEIGVRYTDTLSVNSATVLLDSLQTSANALVYVGNMKHPELGEISAKTFFQITNADTLKIDTLGTKAYKSSVVEVADSLVLRLLYRYVAGDTNVAQTFKVYRVKSSESRSISTIYNNTSDLPAYEPTPIGTVSLKNLRPIRNPYATTDTGKYAILRIPLTAALKEEIFSYRNKASASAVVYDKFKDVVKGMVLVSESPSNAAIVGFSTYTSDMMLYYHYTYKYPKSGVDTTVTTKDSLAFYMLYSPELNARYTQFTAKRTGAIAKLTTPGQKVTAVEAGYKVYLDAAGGLAIKVNFPSLLKLKEQHNVAINKAELIFEPDALPTGFNRPPDLIAVEDNGLNRPLRVSSGALAFLSSETSISTFEPKAQVYTFNVTSAIQNILSGRIANNGWIITPTQTGYASSTSTTKTVASSSRIVLSAITNASFDSRKIKLKLYYTYINK